MMDEDVRKRASEYVDAFNKLEDVGSTEKSYDLEPMVDTKVGSPEMVSAKAEKANEAKAFGDAWHGEAKPATFKDAFAQARKDGQKVFEFNGKKFSSALKGEMAKPAAKAPVAAPAKPMAEPDSMSGYKAAADQSIARSNGDKIQLPKEAPRPGIMARMREADKAIKGVDAPDERIEQPFKSKVAIK